MTVLDASALIAFLRDERARPRVEQLIRDGDSALPSICAAETIDVLIRRLGVDRDRAVAAIRELTSGSLRALPVDLATALLAGEIRARSDDRNRRPVSMADCVVVAAAGDHGAVATTDTRLLEVAELEGVGTIALER